MVARRIRGRRAATATQTIGAMLCVGFLIAATLEVFAPETPDESRRESKTEPPPSKDYLRFEVTGRREGRLQTSIVKLKDAQGRRVHLVSAVHVADAQYYAELKRRFAGYDAVLYEMVKPVGADPTARGGAPSGVTLLQQGLKNVLELEFQLDAIDYGAENFVHADLDASRFRELQEERGESLFTLLLKGMAVEMGRRKAGESEVETFRLLAALASDDSARALKFVLAEKMESMETVLRGIEAPLLGKPDSEKDENKGSVIIVERNKAALRVLERSLGRGKRNVAIFYGAGHMSDMERRIQTRLGFKRQSQEWLTAWDVRGRETPSKTQKQRSGGLFRSLFGGGKSKRKEPSDETDSKKNPEEKD